MKLSCAKCGVYLGDIRDATLRNGIVYYCGSCANKKHRPSIIEDSMPEIFKDLLRGKF